MTTATCTSIEHHIPLRVTASPSRDGGSAFARAGGGFADPIELLTGDPDRAAELADRIAALGEPWAGRFVAYIASRMGSGVHDDDDPAEVRVRLVDWLQVHRVDALVRALLRAWPCGRPYSEPWRQGVELRAALNRLTRP